MLLKYMHKNMLESILKYFLDLLIIQHFIYNSVFCNTMSSQSNQKCLVCLWKEIRLPVPDFFLIGASCKICYHTSPAKVLICLLSSPLLPL